MPDSRDLAEKRARNREYRLDRVREWAAYVRTHPDEEWGRQVNTLVNAQIESARHFQEERPDCYDALPDSR